MPLIRQRRLPLAQLVAFAAMLGLSACAGRKHSDLAEVTALVKADPKVQAVISQPGQTIEYSQTVTSPKLETVKFRHLVDGVEVIGSGVAMHADDSTQEVDSHLAAVSLNVEPKFPPKEAARIARKIEPGSKVLQKPYLKILPGSGKRPPRLVYVVEVSGQKEVWIDASSREHIATLSDQLEAIEELVRVHSAAGQGIELEQHFENNALSSCELAPLKGSDFHTATAAECSEQITQSCQAVSWQGVPLFTAPQYCAPGEDESAKRASENARRFLQYFQETHGRNSYDDRGAPVVSVVHAGDAYANATWNRGGHYLLYGDGDGVEFRDFSYGLDLAGHEFTHGVLESTAGLLSFGEAGALNESLADFFGKMVEDQDDWSMGARVYVNEDAKKALRDLARPERLQGAYKDASGQLLHAPYPADRSHAAPLLEPCVRANDFCAVHFNATIPGHAWFLIYKKLGKNKTEALLYTTMAHYLNALSGFADAARATLLACSRQLPAEECASVKAIFSATGMTD